MDARQEEFQFNLTKKTIGKVTSMASCKNVSKVIFPLFLSKEKGFT